MTRLRHFLTELDTTFRLISWAEYKCPRSRRRWWRIA